VKTSRRSLYCASTPASVS